jgi:hypothetical protein
MKLDCHRPAYPGKLQLGIVHRISRKTARKMSLLHVRRAILGYPEGIEGDRQGEIWRRQRSPTGGGP